MLCRVRRDENTAYYSVSRPRPLSDPETAAWLAQLGGRIREVRRSKKMTQEQLAELADISPRTLQKLEAGQFSCLVSTLRRIRKGLGCLYDDILPK